ncbi:unnamed protein product [Schistosoma rodhaini]|uniref:Uncharacterized protein n=1 Tax=Schistosoma rodhaini TaxID=6188 RepID=A0AA85GE55_9TREM|nr:unnamed protein product [Schistosoma rodhaini]
MTFRMTSLYAKKMTMLAGRIFRDVGKQVDSLFRNEHADFREEMARLRQLRGKGKRKKGESKRGLAQQ